MGTTVSTDVVARVRAATPERQGLVGRFMDALDGGLQWPAGNAVWCVNMPGCFRTAMAGGLARCVKAGGRCRVVGGEGRSEAGGGKAEVGVNQSESVAGAVGAGEVAATVASVVVKAVVAAMEATGKRLEGRVERVLRGNGAVREEKVELSEEELRKIYARVLLTAKDEAGARDARLKDVFDWYCMKGFSAGEVALKLGCSKACVMKRLSTLRRIAGVRAMDLREYKPFFEEMERSLTEPRARRVRRSAAAYGDDPTDEEEGG
jgi:hypothetical protein